MRSKGAKIGSSVVGGGSVLALAVTFYTHMTGQIEKSEAHTKLYVDQKYDLVAEQVKTLKGGQTEIKNMLIKMNDRLFELKTNN